MRGCENISATSGPLRSNSFSAPFIVISTLMVSGLLRGRFSTLSGVFSMSASSIILPVVKLHTRLNLMSDRGGPLFVVVASLVF